MNPLRHLHRLFLRYFGPTIFGGATFSMWMRILQENRFRVAPRYLGRATLITLLAGGNSISKRVEQWMYGKAIAKTTVHPPLFLLGCWRSGTTHLHNLVSKDDRFAFPNAYHIMNPHSFLHTEAWNKPLQALFLPARRAMDDVRFAANEPQEEEFALAAMCGLSPMVAFSFWNHRDHYNRYTTLKGVPAFELEQWMRSMLQFARKLTFKYDKPLVLKSPAHTARIRLLLDLFPDARFVTIHRHPYEVLVSARHMYENNLPLIALQNFDTARVGHELVEHYGQLFDAYFDERGQIPSGRLIEIRYDLLDDQPLETLQRIYAELNLPSFSSAEPAVRNYLDSLVDFRKNAHESLEPELQRLVADRWRRCFTEWGYLP